MDAEANSASHMHPEALAPCIERCRWLIGGLLVFILARRQTVGGAPPGSRRGIFIFRVGSDRCFYAICMELVSVESAVFAAFVNLGEAFYMIYLAIVLVPELLGNAFFLLNMGDTATYATHVTVVVVYMRIPQYTSDQLTAELICFNIMSICSDQNRRLRSGGVVLVSDNKWHRHGQRG